MMLPATNIVDSMSPEPGRVTQSGRVPHLIPATSVLELIARWRAHLGVLEQHAPNSDVLTSLARCTAELADALAVAHEQPATLSIADAHAISRLPTRQIQRICQMAPATVGARRYGRKWYLDRAAFEAYLAAGDIEPKATQYRTATGNGTHALSQQSHSP